MALHDESTFGTVALYSAKRPKEIASSKETQLEGTFSGIKIDLAGR
jgi:hypothetical protein